MPKGHTEQMLAGCPRPPKQPCSRCNAVSLLYLVDGIMRDSVLVIFPLGGSFSTNTSGVGSSASWTSVCWLDSCKHTEPSQEQTLPSLWLPQGLAGGTPGWATCSLSLPDTLLMAKGDKSILSCWERNTLEKCTNNMCSAEQLDLWDFFSPRTSLISANSAGSSSSAWHNAGAHTFQDDTRAQWHTLGQPSSNQEKGCLKRRPCKAFWFQKAERQEPPITEVRSRAQHYLHCS